MNETTYAQNCQHFLDDIFPEAYALLSPGMNSPAASAELLAIGLQEGRLWYRKQIGGPARGAYQFVQGGGVAGVLSHPASKAHALSVCKARKVTAAPNPVYLALASDDILATCFARLLLYTLPWRLPAQDDPNTGWAQYISAWRPGAPHRGTWDNFYKIAWDTVTTK